MLYFAYGSNLLSRRIKRRIFSASKVATATAEGYRLRFHKRGQDGSAKCNIHRRAGSLVFGVVYEMDKAGKRELDRIEGAGYKNKEIRVRNGERQFRAYTYRATEAYIDNSLRPYRWYRQLVLEGALEHGFPEDYIRYIRESESRPDPDPRRARKNYMILMDE